jgi:hypothetical protein
MPTLNGLFGIVFTFLALVASPPLSSQWGVLIHEFDARARLRPQVGFRGEAGPIQSPACPGPSTITGWSDQAEPSAAADRGGTS